MANLTEIVTKLACVESFDGSNPKKLESFFCSCDFVIKNVEAAEADAYVEAIVALKITDQKAITILNEADDLTWDQVKNKLKTHYAQKKITSLAGCIQAIMSTKQFPNESVNCFSDRLLELYENYRLISNADETGEPLAISAFKSGLFDKQLQCIAYSIQINNLKELITHTIGYRGNLR